MNSNALLDKLRNDALRDQARTERANVLPCSHSMIETYVLDTGEPAGLWACCACKTKFVPITELIEAGRQRDELVVAVEIAAKYDSCMQRGDRAIFRSAIANTKGKS